jgi:hypothetical protein
VDPVGGLNIIGAFVAIFIYFIPLMIAVTRGHHNVGSIAVINVFLGWTFIGSMPERLQFPNHQLASQDSFRCHKALPAG